jgi:hypothetical protein
LAQHAGIAHIRRLSPVICGQRVEAADRLSSWIILDETDVSRDVDFALGPRYFLLLLVDGLRAVAATVVNDLLRGTKEGRMPMQVDRTVFRFVPLSIQQLILGIEQFLDLLGVEFRAIRNGECMIVGVGNDRSI